jgi:hypothetical protein
MSSINPGFPKLNKLPGWQGSPTGTPACRAAMETTAPMQGF